MPQPDAAFLRFLCQVTPQPDGFRVLKAKGSWIFDGKGRRYLDWLAGIGVLNLGHLNPKVVAAIKRQLGKHLHVMVYGEYAQTAQTSLARMLCRLAPMKNARIYFTSSGTEAIEGALKLARKLTRRPRFASFSGAYHGGTFGALSLMGPRKMRSPFMPLLDCIHLPFNEPNGLSAINRRVAAAVIEPIQAEGGVRIPSREFMVSLRKRCTETGTLLILDEIQTGLGRTGKLWCSDHYKVVPDILVLAKAIGGGLPLGAFVAPAHLMRAFSIHPPLSHLTTFGGHPLSCAAGLAALRLTLEKDLPSVAAKMGCSIMTRLSILKREGVIADIRGQGLLIGLALDNPAQARGVVENCRRSGLLVGSALHDESVLRLTPPLTMTRKELAVGVGILKAALLKSKPRAGRSKART